MPKSQIKDVANLIANNSGICGLDVRFRWGLNAFPPRKEACRKQAPLILVLSPISHANGGFGAILRSFRVFYKRSLLPVNDFYYPRR